MSPALTIPCPCATRAHGKLHWDAVSGALVWRQSGSDQRAPHRQHPFNPLFRRRARPARALCSACRWTDSFVFTATAQIFRRGAGGNWPIQFANNLVQPLMCASAAVQFEIDAGERRWRAASFLLLAPCPSYGRQATTGRCSNWRHRKFTGAKI